MLHWKSYIFLLWVDEDLQIVLLNRVACVFCCSLFLHSWLNEIDHFQTWLMAIFSASYLVRSTEGGFLINFMEITSHGHLFIELDVCFSCYFLAAKPEIQYHFLLVTEQELTCWYISSSICYVIWAQLQCLQNIRYK